MNSTRTSDADVRDRLLIAAIANGKEAALREIHLRYRRRIASFARRITGRSDLAEEITSDTMCVIWRGAAGFKGDSKVSTWVLGITYRISVSSLHRLGRSNPDSNTSFNLDECWYEPWSAEQDSEWVQAGLAALPEDQRIALQLFYHFGYSCQEIAERMSCPVNTVKTRMFHGRRRLRLLLAAA